MGQEGSIRRGEGHKSQSKSVPRVPANPRVVPDREGSQCL